MQTCRVLIREDARVRQLKQEDKADFPQTKTLKQCVSEMLLLRSSGAAGRCLELHNRDKVAPFGSEGKYMS